jgi:hypothetical protein
MDTDDSGNTFLGVNLLAEGAESPFSMEEAREEVVVFDADGNETRRLILPLSTFSAEVTRSIRVGPDGAVYQLVLGESGAILRRYHP